MRLALFAMFLSCSPVAEPGREACYSLTSWLGARARVCTGDGVVAKMVEDRYMDGIGCEQVRLIDRDRLYGVCRSRIENMECSALLAGRAPKECWEVFAVSP